MRTQLLAFINDKNSYRVRLVWMNKTDIFTYASLTPSYPCEIGYLKK